MVSKTKLRQAPSSPPSLVIRKLVRPSAKRRGSPALLAQALEGKLNANHPGTIKSQFILRAHLYWVLAQLVLNPIFNASSVLNRRSRNLRSPKLTA